MKRLNWKMPRMSLKGIDIGSVFVVFALVSIMTLCGLYLLAGCSEAQPPHDGIVKVEKANADLVKVIIELAASIDDINKTIERIRSSREKRGVQNVASRCPVEGEKTGGDK